MEQTRAQKTPAIFFDHQPTEQKEMPGKTPADYYVEYFGDKPETVVEAVATEADAPVAESPADAPVAAPVEPPEAGPKRSKP